MDLPVLFLLNKKDKEGFVGYDRINADLKFNEIYCHAVTEIFELSAKSRDGIETALEWIYETIPVRREQIPETPPSTPNESPMAPKEFDDV